MSIGLAISLDLGRGGAAPIELRPLATWFALYDARYTGQSAGALSQWNDLSGNGRHLQQATGAKQPTLSSDARGPLVAFAGAQGLRSGNVDLSGTNAVTVFVVATAASGADQMLFEFSNTASGTSRAWYVYRPSSNKVEALHNGGIGFSTFLTTATLTATPKVISAVLDRSLATNEVTVWLDGASAGTRAFNNNNTDNFAGANPLNLGSRNDAASLALTGDIRMAGVVASALSDANRQAIEAALKATWGTA